MIWMIHQSWCQGSKYNEGKFLGFHKTVMLVLKRPVCKAHTQHLLSGSAPASEEGLCENTTNHFLCFIFFWLKQMGHVWFEWWSWRWSSWWRSWSSWSPSQWLVYQQGGQVCSESPKFVVLELSSAPRSCPRWMTSWSLVINVMSWLDSMRILMNTPMNHDADGDETEEYHHCLESMLATNSSAVRGAEAKFAHIFKHSAVIWTNVESQINDVMVVLMPSPTKTC